MAAKLSSSSPCTFSIGNCTVEIEGDNVTCKSSNSNDLQISVSDTAKIKLSVNTTTRRRYSTRKSSKEILFSQSDDGIVKDSSPSDHSFVVVNPKDIDCPTKSFLQEALKVYRKELPAMNYAANTGKQSSFLERCISNGKYCTLLLLSNAMEVHGEVIAAVTYQIIPADTQYAEVPLAAVCSKYQRKGIGCLLYSELRKRLLNVGTHTIFCWGDKESEEFWAKQGFIPIAEIDTKGKARRLPIKADIRRALCFPGGSTLMVSHLNKDSHILSNPPNQLKSCIPIKAHANSCSLPLKSQDLPGTKESCDISKSSILKEGTGVNRIVIRIKTSQSQLFKKDGCSTDGEKLRGSSHGHDSLQDYKEVGTSKNATTCNNMDNSLCATEDQEVDVGNHCTCSMKGRKRKIWEASCSSIKSKKVKGGHRTGCHPDPSWDLHSKHDQENNCSCSLGILKDKTFVGDVPENALINTCLAVHTGESKQVGIDANEEHMNLRSKEKSHRIMLMNIADDAKKTFLTKIIEELGGVVISDGCNSTHVVTGKARRTLNFCSALCSGSWILSTNWLKESFRKSKFVDESAFILEDEDYALTYKSEVKDAVLRAKAHPRALLTGYYFCLAKHVQPPEGILSAIIKSAGGNVIQQLDKVSEPSKTIFIACEEDTEEAFIAAKRGVWTFCSDWLMNCVMKQELDLQALQFAESL